MTPDPLPPPSPPLRRPRVWPVFATYVAVVVGLPLAELGAVAVWTAMDETRRGRAIDLAASPDLLVLSVLISSTTLIAVSLLGGRLAPERARARLRTGPAHAPWSRIVVAVVGFLALSQAFDSLFALLGWSERGTLGMLHRAIAQMSAGLLVLMLLVAGLLAGTGEELFFRGFMQTRLAACWRPWAAITVTAAAFALLHFDPVQSAFAFVVGVFLGWITELTGSIRPAVWAHVLNNSVSVLQPGFLPRPASSWIEIGLLALCLSVMAGSVVVLRRGRPVSVGAHGTC